MAVSKTHTQTVASLINKQLLRILVLVAVLSSVCQSYGAQSVNLAWNASSDSTVAGYKVYYGTNPSTLLSSSSVDVGANLTATIPNLAVGTYYFGATSYTSNGVESDLSNIASTNFLTAPTITGQTASLTAFFGTTTNLSVTVTGSSPLTYQWFFNTAALADSGNVAGANTAVLTLTSLVDANQGDYQVVVSNSQGTATSSITTLTVINPPSIAAQPSSVTRNSGAGATFSVSANGAPTLNFQWFKNGAALSDGGTILGSATAVLTLTSVGSSDAGSFQCVVTNSSGNVTSSVATLTVVVPPTITTQPSSQTVNGSSLAMFNVVATGTGPLTYAWSKNGGVLANNAKISGAASATLTVANTSSADEATYTVVVSNGAGSATSSGATLNVLTPPNITSQPSSLTTNLNALVTFNVTAQSSQQLNFRWVKDGAPIVSNTNMTGITASSLTINSVQATDSGSYKCIITNATGSVSSSMATLTVLVPPSITSQPADASTSVGASASFNVNVQGTQPMTYQWQFNSAPISGATASALNLSNVQKANAGSYSCTISNQAGSALSSTATLVVDDTTIITSQPANQILNACETLTLTVSAAGSATPTYQWFQNGTAIPGATSSIYSVPGVTRSDAGTYFVQVIGDIVVASSSATVIVNDPVFLTEPVDNCISANATNIFTADACGQSLNYQWFFIPWGSSNVTVLNTATNSLLAVGPAGSKDVGQYFCVVSNNFNSITSRVASLGVETAPTISTQPKNYTVMTGNAVSFAVAATAPSTLTFQWAKSGTNIVGATNSFYTIAAVQMTDAGTYQCYVGTTLCQSTALTSLSNGHLTVTRDHTKPVSKFSYPIANTLFSSSSTAYFGTMSSIPPQIYLSGSAWDDNGVADLTVTRTYPSSSPLTIHPKLSGKPTLSQWTNAVSLVPGTNTFTAIVTDISGLTSTNSINVFLRVPSVLHVNTAGGGSTTPLTPLTFGTPTNGAILDIGRHYRILATPVIGNVFSNWVDSRGLEISSSATLVFRMQTNLQLLANFVTNPIVANNANGSYNGLFYETNEVRIQSSGALFNLLVRTDTTFSGTLKLDGHSYSLTGAFDVHGNATKQLLRTGKTTVTINVHLDFVGKQITGTITSPAPDPWTSVLMADIAPYNSANHFTDSARYTLAISPGAGAPVNSPGGFGYGFVTNTPLGVISFVGTLGDGTPISQTVPISKQGYWPLYIPLYGNRGLIEGWLNFSSGSPGGNVSWIRPSGALTSTYKNGFTNVTRLFGSPYTPMTPSLNPADGALDIGVPQLTFSYAVSNNNAIVKLPGGPANYLAGSISAPTGAVTLSYRPTGATANLVGHGAVLQWNNGAYGCVISNNISMPLHLH
ncbi:MAG: large protein [Verrucomicrobiales bacterium]|nr:large protein [Verrucomicrobiales bacterium]